MRSCSECGARIADRSRRGTCDYCARRKRNQEFWGKNREIVEAYQKTRREEVTTPGGIGYRKRNGIPLHAPRKKNKNGDGCIDYSGYKTICVKGHPNCMDNRGRIREHVYVMSQHLGRPLRKGETVHHKNGNKIDNCIENLELWDRSQPAGQRLEDKIIWAKEYLEFHGHAVIKK